MDILIRTYVRTVCGGHAHRLVGLIAKCCLYDKSNCAGPPWAPLNAAGTILLQ